MKNVFNKKSILLKAIAAVCCAVMMLAPLSTAVSAEEDEVTLPDGLVTKKQVQWEGGADYKLQIETYVTGETVYVKEFVPSDIVLLLDVSTSMGMYKLNEYVAVYGSDISTSGTYYRKTTSGSYEQVYYCSSTTRHNGPGWFTQRHTSSTHNGTRLTPATSESDTNGTVFYKMTSGTQSKYRMAAMQENVCKFIDSMADLNADIRISIVKYAEGQYYNNSNHLAEGDNTTGSRSYNCTQVVKGLTSLTTQNVTALKTAVNNLKSGGNTYTNYGMNLSKEVLDNAAKEKDYDRKQFVIVFTDGVPSSNVDTFSSTIANEALATSNALKNNGAMVFSLACYDDANDRALLELTSSEYSALSNMNKFMIMLSSTVKGLSTTPTMSTAYTTLWQNASEEKFYYTTKTAEEMADAFDGVAREIGRLAVRITEKCVFKDYIAPDFALVRQYIGGEFDVNYGITWHTETFTGKDAKGNALWSVDDPSEYADVNIIVTDPLDPLTGDNCSQLIEVTGFDGAQYYVDYEMKSSSHVGKKLVINIPIQYNGADGAGGNVNTNGKDSGWYDENGEKIPGGEVPSPIAEIPTVTAVSLTTRHKADPTKVISFEAVGAVKSASELTGTEGYTQQVVLDDSDLKTSFTLVGKDDEETTDTVENGTILYGRDYEKLGQTPKPITINVSDVPLGYKLYASFNGTETEVSLSGTTSLSGTYSYTPSGVNNEVEFILDYKPTYEFILGAETTGDIASNIQSFTVSYTDYDNVPVSMTFNLEKGTDTKTTSNLTAAQKKLLAAVPEDAVVTILSNGHDGFILNYVDTSDAVLDTHDTYNTPAMKKDTKVIAKFISGMSFPNTGSIGTTVFTVIGLMLMIGALTCLLILGKKRTAENRRIY